MFIRGSRQKGERGDRHLVMFIRGIRPGERGDRGGHIIKPFCKRKTRLRLLIEA
jgi:hypothetical protein